MDRILISRTDGIGDLLLTTPLIHSLKTSYPGAKITVLVSKYANDLLLNNPDVDSTIIYDKKERKTALPAIKSGEFDAVVAAYPRPELAWLFFRAGIPQRYGTASRWYSIFYNRPVRMSRKKSERSEADYNIMAAGKLLDLVTADREYYYITEDEKKKGLEYLEKKGLKPGFIILHPGSKGSAWNLSEAAYAKLANELLKNGYSVLLTGGNPEKCMLRRINDYVTESGKLFIMEEELSLRELAAVIYHSAALISSSTGPMHIAAALGVRTLSFFPPDNIAAMKPRRWAPLGNKQAIIQPAVDLPREKAMDSIDVKLILSKLKELVEK